MGKKAADPSSASIPITHQAIRLGYILEQLCSTQKLDVQQVSKVLKRDPRTIRNDLERLLRLPSLRRTYGGIALEESQFFFDRSFSENRLAKEDVARRAAEEFRPGKVISVSPGVTTTLTAERLMDLKNGVTFVTNNVGVLEHVRTASIQTIFVGGEYYASIHACIGTRAERTFEEIPVDEGIIGVYAALGDGRLALFFESEIPVMHALLASIHQRIVIVADLRKIGHTAGFRFAQIEELIQGPHGPRKVLLITNRLRDWARELDRGNARAIAKALAELRKCERRNKGWLRIEEVPKGYSERPGAEAD